MVFNPPPPNALPLGPPLYVVYMDIHMNMDAVSGASVIMGQFLHPYSMCGFRYHWDCSSLTSEQLLPGSYHPFSCRT